MLHSVCQVQLFGLGRQVLGEDNSQYAVQEGCTEPLQMQWWKKRTKAQGPGHPQGKKKTNQTPVAMACNIKEWVQAIEDDDSKVELRNGRVGNHRAEPRNAWSQNVSRVRRHHRRQGRPQFPQDASGGSPSSGGGSSDQLRMQSKFPSVEP